MLISLEVMVFGWFKSSSSVPCPCVVDFFGDFECLASVFVESGDFEFLASDFESGVFGRWWSVVLIFAGNCFWCF
ncbi:hypothetical protein Hanom_Chr16g01421901 [Helianthus anomalus]